MADVDLILETAIRRNLLVILPIQKFDLFLPRVLILAFFVAFLTLLIELRVLALELGNLILVPLLHLNHAT